MDRSAASDTTGTSAGNGNTTIGGGENVEEEGTSDVAVMVLGGAIVPEGGIMEEVEEKEEAEAEEEEAEVLPVLRMRV